MLVCIATPYAAWLSSSSRSVANLLNWVRRVVGDERRRRTGQRANINYYNEPVSRLSQTAEGALDLIALAARRTRVNAV